MGFWTLSVWYLRISTCQILSTLSPLIVMILSIIFLGEKFYYRYIYGIVSCFIGSCFIILNEDKGTSDKTIKSTSDIIKGVIYNIASVLVSCIASLSNKILAKNRISIISQLFYVGLCNLIYSFIFMIITSNYSCTIKYFIMCGCHIILFYVGNVNWYYALQVADLSISTLMGYIKIVIVFFLGEILLHEPIFLTDILGVILILSFMILNLIYPINN